MIYKLIFYIYLYNVPMQLCYLIFLNKISKIEYAFLFYLNYFFFGIYILLSNLSKFYILTNFNYDDFI